MDNKKISQIFEEMGNILDIKGEDFFRVNAYKKASQTILNLSKDLEDIYKENNDTIPKIPGIGEGLKSKIIELIISGKCREHEDMKKGFPTGLLELLEIRGIGPKKVKLFYSQLGITSVKQLKDAAEKHMLRDLEKMGEKSETQVLKSIEDHMTFSSERMPIDEALYEANRIIEYMKQVDEIKHIQYAGSLRRWQETIGDIDILCTVKNFGKSHEEVIKQFVSYRRCLKILAQGETKASIILESGIQVDLRVIDDERFGAALHYFTGSKQHNIHIREIAKTMGLKISEYGVFEGEKNIAGKTEEELFNTLGLPFMIPEIRRDEGEFDYAMKHKKFPDFVELGDIKGDLHMHTKYSDGLFSVKEMAEASILKGYEYIAITDHSTTMGMINSMSSKELKLQKNEIEEAEKILKNKIKIFHGVECDILKDGSLNLPDDVLKTLDVVIIAAHMYQNLEEEDQTKRIISAIENPYSKILAHPTGRLINRRPELNFNMEKIIDACIQNDVYLEINSNPNRLDLVDKYARMAKEKGAKFSIATDSHAPDQLDFIKFGVGVARRGWLTKDDVVNTNSLNQFKNKIKI